MPAFTLVPAESLPPAQLHAAFAAAFADYLLGPFQVPLAQWPQFLGRQGVDIALSRVALREGEAIAFCLVAPRPECGSWRLGTMGALPPARGSGAAPALLDDFIARAAAAGVGQVELECFAQNPRALRLYEGRGFVMIDVLYGYEHQAVAGAAGGTPRIVPLEDAFDWLDVCGAAGCELPLQVTPRSLRTLPVALQAWRQGSAQLVFSEGAGERLQVNSLVDRDPAQRDAEALVASLLARFPGSTVHVPQLQRPSVGGAALERLGFQRLPLHQVWMRRGT